MTKDEPTATKTSTASFAVSLLSGGMAGFAVDVLLFPLDTVKTRLQVTSLSFLPHNLMKLIINIVVTYLE